MPDLADQLRSELPYLRRYARALTGTQSSGDDLAFITLQNVLEDRATLQGSIPVRVALFKLFHEKWRTVGLDAPTMEDGVMQKAQSRLAKLARDSREALLLTTIEEFTPDQVATILGTQTKTVSALLKQAKRDMQDGLAGAILIIEDEPIIAADLTQIVEAVGHKVIGIGRTRAEAVDLGKARQPDLILADIQLADGSSGIDAAGDLLKTFGDVPVIFITAFPEWLLTGTRPEPTFLISKPYNAKHVTSAVSQAMFFATTELISEI